LIYRSFVNRAVRQVVFWVDKEMTGQSLAIEAAGARRPLVSIFLAVALAALALIGTTTADAKQQCSTAAASQGYWSWRMIDGRKCWYEGKPMLSKSELEWATQSAARPAPTDEPASAPPEMRRDPMDAQARVPDDSGTFEALWRSRIEH
jgi:hypothetical protein